VAQYGDDSSTFWSVAVQTVATPNGPRQRLIAGGQARTADGRFTLVVAYML
jgi:hypothetical protein